MIGVAGGRDRPTEAHPHDLERLGQGRIRALHLERSLQPDRDDRTARAHRQPGRPRCGPCAACRRASGCPRGRCRTARRRRARGPPRSTPGWRPIRPSRSIGIIPSAGKMYFVFQSSMYSALPTNVMRLGSEVASTKWSRTDRWLGPGWRRRRRAGGRDPRPRCARGTRTEGRARCGRRSTAGRPHVPCGTVPLRPPGAAQQLGQPRQGRRAGPADHRRAQESDCASPARNTPSSALADATASPRARPRRWRPPRRVCRGRRRAGTGPRRAPRARAAGAGAASHRSSRSAAGASARRPTPTTRGSGARRSPGGWPAASQVFSRSLMKTRLPSDLDIFSPSMRTIAWCIQWRTKVWPVAASLWAASHSWCGKIRSAPPPCRSMVVSSSRSASAEHSMCQPGRPGPHSDSHDGSSGADGCQRTKSSGSRLFGSSGLPPRSRGQFEHLVALEVADLTEALELVHVEVHRPAALVGVALVEHHPDEAADVGDGGRGPGLAPALDHVERAHVAVEPGHLGGREVEVVDAELARLARAGRRRRR